MLNLKKDCLKFYKNKRPIKTVSSSQARKPMYNKSILSYKNYEKYMEDFFFQKIEN